jgi:hypothetical protein
MLAASWVGLGAGLLPPARGRREIALLAVYGALSAFAYGMLMNLWFWPFTTGTDSQLSYVAGAPVLENLHRFIWFTFATSMWGWDMGRAITNAVAIVVLGPAVLLTSAARRRAAFSAPCRSHSGARAARSDREREGSPRHTSSLVPWGGLNERRNACHRHPSPEPWRLGRRRRTHLRRVHRPPPRLHECPCPLHRVLRRGATLSAGNRPGRAL